MESTKNKKEEYEVLQALYDFTATIAQTISFKRNDYFVFHSSNNIKKNWWNVINSHGKVGYIPSNYVDSVTVSKTKLLEFLDSAIECLNSDISIEGGGTDKQLETMKELISRKQELLDRKQQKTCLENREKLTSSKSLPNSRTVQSEVVISKREREEPSPPVVMRVSQSETKFPSEGAAPVPAVTALPLAEVSQNQLLKKLDGAADAGNITVSTVYSLIQQVRCGTGLSHEDSRLAVGVVAEGLLELLPAEAGPSLEAFLDQLRSANLRPPPSLIDRTQDAVQMRSVLQHLTAAREDGQQRSWALWDDEHALQTSISKLSSILKDADPMICQRVLKSNNYSDISMLVDYYQMEERFSLRTLLVQAFALLCCLDRLIISLLLNSILPVELAREMQTNINDPAKLESPAKLLAMIFSCGEPMPITHLDQLGLDFIKMVLETIESEAGTEVGHTMVTLVLSYNLQFKPKSPANITVQAISEVESTKFFTEKILLLINREVDPVSSLKTQTKCDYSVLKLLTDLFADPKSGELFYTNDVRVLMDIIVRQITDLPPNHKKRTEYLELCKLVLLCCEPQAFEHRLRELRSRFAHILTEEQPQVDEDKMLVRQIVEALPRHFGTSIHRQPSQDSEVPLRTKPF